MFNTAADTKYPKAAHICPAAGCCISAATCFWRESASVNTRASRFIWAALLVQLVAFFYAWFFAPPVLNTDSASGFLVWESMAAGGPWNSWVAPDPTDLGVDRPEFLSWWSPGQWVLPGLIHALGITWCKAALLVTLLATTLGILGTWRLGRRAGLNAEQAALGCLLLSVAGGTLHSYGMFLGGDILLIPSVPFIYIAALNIARTPPVRGALVFFAVCLVALFLKHSAIFAITGALLFCGVESLRRHGMGLVRDPRPWAAAAAAASAYALAHLLWVRGGVTAASGLHNAFSPLSVFAFDLNGPWLALTGVGSLIGWIAQRPGCDDLFQLYPAVFLFFGVCSSAAVAHLGFRRNSPCLWRLVACAWVSTAGLFVALHLRGATISLEERHFRPAVTLFGLALAGLALAPPVTRRRVIACTAGILIAGTIILALSAHVRRVHLLADLPRGAVSGFSQPELSSETYAALLKDAALDATLGLVSPAYALEFPDCRRWVSDAALRSSDELGRWRFQGKPTKLVLAFPSHFEGDGRGALLRGACVDISANDWIRSSAGTWTIWRIESAPNAKSEP